MLIASGSFTGNGTSQSITGLGWTPTLVFIRNLSSTAGVRLSWTSSSMAANKTASTVGAIANYSGGITSLDADGFSVGSDVTVNENTKTVQWIAFKDNGLGDIKVGTYTGTNSGDQAITGLGFSPAMVFVKGDTTTRGRYATSAFAANKTAGLENISFEADKILSLDADGFTLKNNGADVNANTITYYYFAFKAASSYFKVGTYVGNLTDNRDITGVGFQPVFTWIKADGLFNWCGRFPSSVGDLSLANSGTSVEVADIIQAFQADGFQIGANVAINTNLANYYYMSWGIPPAATGTHVFGDEGMVS